MRSPIYTATTSMVVNFAVVDDLGPPCPDKGAPLPVWTELWGTVHAARRGEDMVAATLLWTFSGLAQCYFAGYGAAIMDPADPGHCVLDSPAAQQAAEALFTLLSSGVCVQDNGFTVPTQKLLSGKCASAVFWNAALVITDLDAALARLTKWDFDLKPFLPRGGFAPTVADFRAINAQTQVSGLAWDLLEFLCFEPDFQRTRMRFGLLPPCLKTLQEEYVTLLQQLIPAFRTKDLGVLTHYMLRGGAVMEAVIPANQAQPDQLLQDWEMAILQRQGLRQCARQVDAVVQAGPREQVLAPEREKAFPTRGPSIAEVPSGV